MPRKEMHNTMRSYAPRLDSLQRFLGGEMKWKEIQEFAIRTALLRHRGNRTHTAKSLGICLRTLRMKLQEFDLTDYPKELKEPRGPWK